MGGGISNPDNNIYQLMVNGQAPNSGQMYFPMDDHSIPVASGINANNPQTAEGLYRIGKVENTGEKGMQLTKEVEEEYIDKHGKKRKRKKTLRQGWKARLIAVTDDTGEDVTVKVWDPAVGEYRQGKWDPAAGRYRTSQLIHPDQSPRGTLGCAGIQGYDASTDMRARLEDGEQHLLTVKHFNSQEELEAYKAKLREFYRDRRNQRNQRQGSSDQSTTNQRQALLIHGERTVMSGPDKRPVAHVGTPDTGGAQLAQGSPSVFVGPQRKPLGRVDDPTTMSDLVLKGDRTVQSA